MTITTSEKGSPSQPPRQAGRQEQLLALEHRITRCLADSDDAGRALRAVLQAVCEVEGWACGRYFRVDESAGLLRLEQAWNEPSAELDCFIAATRDSTYGRGVGLAGHAWQSGTPIWSADAQQDPRTAQAELVRAARIHGTFVLPVKAGDAVIGIFSFASPHTREPDQRLLDALGVIASQIGQFLRRKQGESEQAGVRQLLDNIVDNIPTAVQLKSVQDDYRIVLWNKAAEAMFGVSRAEAIGHTVHDLWPAAAADRMDAADRELTAQGGMQNFPDRPAQTRHKGVIRVHMRKLLLTDAAGRPTHLLVVADDITADLEDKARLSESEARFRSLTELSSDWYWEQDENLRYVSRTGAAKDLFSPGPGDAHGKTRWELPVVGVSEAQWQAHREILAARLPFHDFTYRRVDQQGQLRWVSISGHPVFDEEGRFRGYRGIGKDITAAKQVEAALQRFRAAIDLTTDSILLVDRRTMRFVDVNEGACRMLGYTREELLALSPEDVAPGSRADFERVYDGMVDGAVSTFATRHRRKDGTQVPVEVVRSAIQVGDQRIILAQARDITARMAAEEALRSSSERFELVTRATNDVVWDWDLRSDKLWWSDNYRKAFGYAEAETAPDSSSWTGHIHPEDRERIKLAIHAVIDGAGEFWSGEYRFQRRDGAYVHVYDRGYVIRDAAGQAQRMIGAMVDLTERKQGEEGLRRSAHRQRLLADLGKLALADTDADALAEYSVFLLCDTLGFEYGEILQLAPDGRGLVLRAMLGWPEERVGRQVMTAEQDGHLSYALARREPVLVADVAAETRFAPSALAAAQNIACGIAVSIPGRDGPYGVVGVHSATRRPMAEEDGVFVQAVANLLATALQRKHAEQLLAHMAQFDTLTGLPNRQLFRDRLLQTIGQAKRGGRAAAVVYVNLDNFNLVNDTYGHEAGDQFLIAVAQRLAGCVRGGDTVSRSGGDEFGIILSNLAQADDAARVAQKIIAALTAPFQHDGAEVFISASMGIALCPADGDQPDSLIKNAAIAMYRAKELGRNTYQFYTAQMNQRAESRLLLEGQLRRALERGEFLLHYQPKVALASGAITGAEALLRWNHPERGLVSPAEFIPILEETGLIMPVGLWVLDTACRQLEAWRRAGLTLSVMAVNLSPRQFQQADLVERVAEIISATGVDAAGIELEITESMLMNDPELAITTLGRLKGLGLRLSVDDFGTGYSSLAYLKRFPIDVLKIDRAFVKDIATNPDDATICLTIINLAHNLRLRVVAEGVEDRPQLRFLMRHGCDMLQGYLFSRPVDAGAFAGMLGAGKKLDLSGDGGQEGMPTLLVLDDSQEDLLLFTRALAGEPYRVLTAGNATEAFELLAGSDVQVVISDQNMPGMSGVDFLSRVRQIYPGSVRVMFTGGSDPKDISDAVNAAAIHKFISKNWDAAQVRATLREAFQQAGNAAAG